MGLFVRRRSRRNATVFKALPPLPSVLMVPILGTMRVIAKPALIHFWGRYPDAEGPLTAWYSLMRHRAFSQPNELRADFGSVSLLADGHACFNIGGNKYRLLVHIRYDIGIVFIRRLLTHAEYTKLTDAGTLIEKR